jgi:hypothetical protein
VNQTIAQRVLTETVDNFNRDHPEREPGEIWLCNATNENYHNIGWKTKRVGMSAYTKNGEYLSKRNGLFPVFVQAEELEVYSVYE